MSNPYSSSFPHVPPTSELCGSAGVHLSPPGFTGNFTALTIICSVYIHVSKQGSEDLGGIYLIDCLKL